MSMNKQVGNRCGDWSALLPFRAQDFGMQVGPAWQRNEERLPGTVVHDVVKRAWLGSNYLPSAADMIPLLRHAFLCLHGAKNTALREASSVACRRHIDNRTELLQESARKERPRV